MSAPRLAVLAVLVFGALAFAAAAGAAHDPREPQQRHTTSDMKLARSIALRQKDLTTDWKPAAKGKQTPPCVGEPDESKLVETGQVDPAFLWKDGVTSIGTQVDVFRTKAMAQRDWDLSTLDLFRRCLLQSARAQLTKKVTVTIASTQKLAAPALGDRSLHYRIVFAVHGASTVRLVTDVIALGRGRVTAVLHSFSVGTALPDAAVQPLVTLLAKRLGTSVPKTPAKPTKPSKPRPGKPKPPGAGIGV